MDIVRQSSQSNTLSTPQMTKRSYTYDSIMRLNNIENCLIDMQRSRDEVMINIGDILEREKNKFVLQREKSSSILRLDSFQKETENQKKALEDDCHRIVSLRDNIRSRRIALEDAKKRYQNEKEYLEESYKILERDRETLFETSSQLFTRRRELISDLSKIYPLEHTPEVSPFSYKIFNIPLPNSVYDGYDEEKVATALGFASHFVQMLAYYLDAPLRFPITPMSSRSTILDPITVSLTTSRQGYALHETSIIPLIWFFKWFISNLYHWNECCCFSSNQLGAPFPLHIKGVDRNRFDYAVYLLNKNIEQLMNLQGLNLMDLRHTLPNLNYLILSLSSTSTSHISHLRKTIPHKCTITNPFNEINSSNSDNNNSNSNNNNNNNNSKDNGNYIEINNSNSSLSNNNILSKESLNNNISKAKMGSHRKTNAEFRLQVS